MSSMLPRGPVGLLARQASLLTVTLALAALLQVGCASQPSPYVERYDLDSLTVVLLDETGRIRGVRRR